MSVLKYFTAVTCESLTLKNGLVIYNASGVTYNNSDFYYVDTMASFICNDGYYLSGPNSSICQTFGGGYWNQQTSKCIQGDEVITVLLFLCIKTANSKLCY